MMPPTERQSAPAMATEINGLTIPKLKVEELRTELRARNLQTTGLKSELINRLSACLGIPAICPDSSKVPHTRSQLEVDGQLLGKMPVAELRAALERRNLSSEGKKAQLQERLMNYLEENEGPSPGIRELELGPTAPVKVLMVAEKPIMAKQIARILAEKGQGGSGGGRVTTRKDPSSPCPVYEYHGQFRGNCHATFKVTSTRGHILRHEFADDYRDWRRHAPVELFSCPVVKIDTQPSAKMRAFLASEARGCHFLVLWLDCDAEGENICFEVIDAVRAAITKSLAKGADFVKSAVFRAKFSSLEQVEAAMGALVKPNLKMSLAVEAKKELDLRVGVAFSCFQTAYFRRRMPDRDVKLLSFGPCQTPTLGFCVEQHDRVETFLPEKTYSIQCEVKFAPCEAWVKLEQGHPAPFRSELEAGEALKSARDGRSPVVSLSKIVSTRHEKQPPKAMNTVGMLKSASTQLGLSPSEAMDVAEALYTRGYISYPRTETSQYPLEMDPRSVAKRVLAAEEVSEWSGGRWRSLEGALGSMSEEPPRGMDKGDHPPIYPIRAGEGSLSGDERRLHSLICRHFLATTLPPCHYDSRLLKFRLGEVEFHCRQRVVTQLGFTTIMPSQRDDSESEGDFTGLEVGQSFPLGTMRVVRKKSAPPTYLTEAKLIAKMEQYEIGTDASIPGHIRNIVERGFVKIAANRRLVPTPLGVALIRAHRQLDPELVRPTRRAQVEKQLSKIASGEASFDDVRGQILADYKEKFIRFAEEFPKVEALFQGCFPPRAISTQRGVNAGCANGRKRKLRLAGSSIAGGPSRQKKRQKIQRPKSKKFRRSNKKYA